MIIDGETVTYQEKKPAQPIELSVVAPDGSFELKVELPATASRLEQSEWRTTLARIAQLLANTELFLQARTHVTEILPKNDPDSWAQVLTGMLVPETGDFLQHGLAPTTRDAIALIIQEKTQNGGPLHLDFGTLPTLKATGSANTVDLADWLIVMQIAALKKQLQSSTGQNTNEIQITGQLTLADWTEAPLSALAEPGPQAADAHSAETKLQEIQKIFQNIVEPSKPTESCDITITMETAAFASAENLAEQEELAEKLALQLQEVWEESEAIFTEAFPHLKTSAKNWLEFFQTVKKNQAGAQPKDTADTTNDYRSLIEAILGQHAVFNQKLQSVPGFTSFGAMTPVWKEGFLRQILQRIGQPSSESYDELLKNDTLVKQSLLFLARKIVFAEMQKSSTSTIHYDWNVAADDTGTGNPKSSETIPLRVLGKASRQIYDLATTELTVVDPRTIILTNDEKKLLEKAQRVQTGELKLSDADAQTLARELAALSLKQQGGTTLLFVRTENLNAKKTLSTTTAKLVPTGSSTAISIPMALQ